VDNCSPNYQKIESVPQWGWQFEIQQAEIDGKKTSGGKKVWVAIIEECKFGDRKGVNKNNIRFLYKIIFN
jgi:hypothetical protein